MKGKNEGSLGNLTWGLNINASEGQCIQDSFLPSDLRLQSHVKLDGLRWQRRWKFFHPYILIFSPLMLYTSEHQICIALGYA